MKCSKNIFIRWYAATEKLKDHFLSPFHYINWCVSTDVTPLEKSLNEACSYEPLVDYESYWGLHSLIPLFPWGARVVVEEEVLTFIIPTSVYSFLTVKSLEWGIVKLEHTSFNKEYGGEKVRHNIMSNDPDFFYESIKGFLESVNYPH